MGDDEASSVPFFFLVDVLMSVFSEWRLHIRLFFKYEGT